MSGKVYPEYTNLRPAQRRAIPWGWKNIVDEATGVPIVVEHLGRIRMPADLTDYFDWDHWGDSVEQTRSQLPYGTHDMKSVFTTAVRFLGWEGLALAMQEWDFSLAEIGRAFLRWNARLFIEAPERVQVFVIGDDIAGNTGLLISRESFRRLVLPEWRKLAQLAQAHEAAVVVHSDGDIYEILGDIFSLEPDVILYEPVGRMRQVTEWPSGRLVPVRQEMRYRGYPPRFDA